MTNRGPVELEVRLRRQVEGNVEGVWVRKEDLKALLEMVDEMRKQGDYWYSRNLELTRQIRELAITAGFEGLKEQMVGV